MGDPTELVIADVQSPLQEICHAGTELKTKQSKSSLCLSRSSHEIASEPTKKSRFA